MSIDLTRKFAGDRKEDIESGRWIKVQERIFTRWANAYLKTRKMRITVGSPVLAAAMVVTAGCVFLGAVGCCVKAPLQY